MAFITPLAAGAVFAQDVEISGYFRVGADLIAGNSEEAPDKDDPNSGWQDKSILGAGVTGFRGRVTFNATNEDETFGGYLRLQADAGNELGDYGVAMPDTIFLRHGWAWWQPIDLLRLSAGYRFNDFFAVYDIVDTFGGNAEETGVYNSGTNKFDGIVNGALGQQFDQSGVALSLTPVEGLAINIGLPIANGYVGKYAPYTVEKAYLGTGGSAGLLAQVTYEMADTFRAALAFRVNKNTIAGIDWGSFTGTGVTDVVGDDDFNPANSALYAAFYLTAIENMTLNFGLRYTMATTELGFDFPGVDNTFTWNHPVLIGLGFNYDMDALGIGARIGVSLGGSYKWETKMSGTVIDDGDVKGDTIFGIQILPSYDLGALKVFLNAGVTIVAPGDNGDPKPETKIGFHINPYVEKAVGGGSFYAGVDIFSDGTDDKDVDGIVNWRIPCGMKFSF